MQRVVIIDYGSGNLHSAHKAVERAARDASLNCDVLVSSNAGDVAGADRVILPGVGAFGDCKQGLENVPGLVEALRAFAVEQQRPFLGICVGMQLMATRGLEFGTWEGLGWLAGEVTAIQPNAPQFKIPHMGWNTLSLRRDHALLDGLALGPNGMHAYFVHSYHFAVQHDTSLVAETDYGGPITAIVARDNLFGTQFHPEKSQALGLRLLANFLKWSV